MTPEEELELLMAEPKADGEVVRLKISFPDSPRSYTYALIKLGGRWYITGAESKKSRSWGELAAWLGGKGATVISIERATEWETL